MRWLCSLLRTPEADLWALADKAGGLYKSFDVWKGERPDGSDKGWRHIDHPVEELERVQRRIYKVLLNPLAPQLPKYLTGGMPGRSVLDNASPHLNQPAVVGLDIHNCFPSIPHDRIFQVWRNDLRHSDDIATLLTMLTTHHGHLPQGAPTSPMLCNLALRPMAHEINIYAKNQGLIFTIYVDDITLSGGPLLTRTAIGEIVPIVSRHGYRISRSKVPIMDANEIQKTTGVKVNNTLTVPRAKIQALIREIKRVGALGHQATTHDLNHIWGTVSFIKFVNTAVGTNLEQLASRAIGDIAGCYVSRPQDRRRPCISMKASHR